MELLGKEGSSPKLLIYIPRATIYYVVSRLHSTFAGKEAMHEPDYADYSINELQDCLTHINQEKYPDRYRALELELRLRLEAGEAPTDPLINELTARDVPPGLALSCFLCFFWRFGLAIALSQLLVLALERINTLLNLLEPVAATPIFWVVRTTFLLAAGVLIMGQVLAKRYSGYRIRIVPTQTIKQASPQAGSAAINTSPQPERKRS